MKQLYVFKRNHLALSVICFLLLLIALLVFFLISDLNLTLMTPYEMASFFSENIWSVVTALGTIAAAWAAYYAAKVSLKIARETEERRQQEQLKKNEDDLLMARLVLASIFPKIRVIKTFLEMLSIRLKDINEDTKPIPPDLSVLIQLFLTEYAYFPKWTKEHFLSLKPLPNRLGIELSKSLSLLIPVFHEGDSMFGAQNSELSPRVVYELKKFILYVNARLDIIFPDVVREADMA